MSTSTSALPLGTAFAPDSASPLTSLDRHGQAIATNPGTDSHGYHTEESCTQYNVLKIVRHLFKWAPTDDKVQHAAGSFSAL